MRTLLVIASLLAWACNEDDRKEPGLRPDFEFGSATSGYQVEGGNTTSDWYQWESVCGACTSDSNLDGPNFWEHYAADLAEARAMGHTAFRMGLEWAKIEPTAGTYDTAVLAHYRAIMQAARDQGLTLMVTLQHFTLPLWVSNSLQPTQGLGGWAGTGCEVGTAPIIDAFARFAGDMASEYGDLVDLWVTLNEPMVFLSAAYVGGVFPPGRQGQAETMIRAAHNMAFAHARAYDAIHANDGTDTDGDGAGAAVSIAKHWRIADARPLENAFDPEAAERAAEQFNYFFNHLFLRSVTQGHIDLNADGDTDDTGESVEPTLRDKLDWLGINYYSRFIFTTGPTALSENPGCGHAVQLAIGFYDTEPGVPLSDLSWEIYPKGMQRALEEAAGYGLPLRVTENGIADADDDQRPGFIVSHMQALEDAVRNGVDVRGYYHWSLLDNFEWAEGYAPRFGLLRVDYADPARARTRTRGAEAYSAIIANHGVSAGIRGEFGSLGD